MDKFEKTFCGMLIVLVVTAVISCIPRTCKEPGCARVPYGNDKYCHVHDPYSPYTYRAKTLHTSSTTATSKPKTTSKPKVTSKPTPAKEPVKVKTVYTSTKTPSKKAKMPDCDDYEDYDDFMDDWDGCMPDGSDAEDYWEDW